jgi:hypothetical protein
MSFSTIQGVIPANVAPNGTFVTSYPSGTNEGTFVGGFNHSLNIEQINLQAPVAFTLTFAAGTITVTNLTTSTWPAGSNFWLGVESPGELNLSDSYYQTKPVGVVEAKPVLVTLGSPAAASATAILAAVSTAGPSNLLPATVTLNTPRALNIVSSNAGDTTQTITITGKDIYGKTITASAVLNGTTSVNLPAKAFYSVSGVACSAATTGNISVGTRDVFGLPMFLPNSNLVYKELVNGVAPGNAGAFTAGAQTAGGSTKTTADVRGVYAPYGASDGATGFQFIAFLPDVGFLGMPQA